MSDYSILSLQNLSYKCVCINVFTAIITILLPIIFPMPDTAVHCMRGHILELSFEILSLCFMSNPIVWLNPGKIHLLVIQEEGESKVECCPPDLGVTFFFVLVLLWCQISWPDKLMPKLRCCVTFPKVAINV